MFFTLYVVDILIYVLSKVINAIILFQKLICSLDLIFYIQCMYTYCKHPLISHV